MTLAQIFANQRSLKSFGFTIVKSRSMRKMLSGDSESARHPVTFADNGERNELRGLNKTGGRNKKRERRVWTEPFNPNSRRPEKIL